MSEVKPEVEGKVLYFLKPNSALVGEKVRMPLNLQIENSLKIPIKVNVATITVDDVVTLYIEVCEK